MGMMGGILGFGTAARQIGEAVGGAAEVFVGNRAQREAADADRFQAVVAEQSAEFAAPPAEGFHGFVDGLNRLPRPMLAIGTLGLFVYAMVEPVGFGLRMEGLQHVPEPLWWLLGAIVSFYFGAREFHYWRGGAAPSAAPGQAKTQVKTRVKTVARIVTDDPAEPSAEPLAALGGAAAPDYNAALEEWRRTRR